VPVTSPAFTVRSGAGDYSVEEFGSIGAAIRSVGAGSRSVYLVDETVASLHAADLAGALPAERTLLVEASETAKSLEALSPLVCRLLEMGIRRDGTLIVVGGGTLQDIGCFLASILFRGIAWELVPTTLLAQADSCIGSKSSINVGAYKNQVGTFYPPRRVLLTPAVLATLPWDETRSGLGEVIKLQLLAGEGGFRELMADLERSSIEPSLLARWVRRSLEVKKTFIETDEYDQGIRNLLNYGHTFGHAYESATHYAIPHGIAVILGMLTATRISASKGFVPRDHYRELRAMLQPWYRPYQARLRGARRDEIFRAIRMDKKNSSNAINCILTRGFGRMEKCTVDLEAEVVPVIDDFIADETTDPDLS
jgi:3-dehydroquinate synthase